MNKTKKVYVVFALLLVFSLLLTACQPKTAAKNDLDVIKERGKLIIGAEGAYPPFTYYDEQSNLTGFDIEIAKEIAKRLGVEAQFEIGQWDGLFAGLDANRFDVIISEVTIRADRQEKYDFSIPYIKSNAVLIVGKDNDTIKSFADLQGKKCGQVLTSGLSEIAKNNGAEIVTATFTQAIDLITSGRIDCTVHDSLTFLDYQQKKPDLQVKIAAEDDAKTEQGAMMRKGQTELKEAIDKAINEMMADGTYLKISEKYFGRDVSK